MTDRISEREYLQGCRDIAEDLAKDAKAGEFGTGEAAREGLGERLHETIDGHEWVIYTYKAQQVLSLSQNDAYSIEEFGIESVVKDGSLNWSALAFGALYADVLEALDRVDGFDVNDPNPEPEEDDEPEPEPDEPKSGKIYRLTGTSQDASIARGDGWKDSEVKD